MPGIARVDDSAFSATDTHFVPFVGPVQYPVHGTFSEGSSSYYVNNKPVVRLGDGGSHQFCSGSNTFFAISGSSTHFANSKPVVRVGDSTYHCSDVPGAGIGQVISGSWDTFSG